MRLVVRASLLTVMVLSLAPSVVAQEDLQKRVDQLGKRVDELEARQRQPVMEVHRDAGAAVLMLFGAFCALWAQNTHRNPWLWFFCGLLFHVITVLVLLAKNSDDRREARGEPATSGSMVPIAILGGVLIVVAMVGILAWLWAR